MANGHRGWTGTEFSPTNTHPYRCSRRYAHGWKRGAREAELEINLPAPRAEVAAAFARYEEALIGNDIATLDALFLDSRVTIRYGIGENLYGIEAVRAFRSGRSATGLGRRLEETVITTYGMDCATASTLFFRDSAPGKVGRQMQTWIRTEQGWRVAAAHVSIIDNPA